MYSKALLLFKINTFRIKWVEVVCSELAGVQHIEGRQAVKVLGHCRVAMGQLHATFSAKN